MTIKEYQRKAMRTATHKCYDAANAALGLTGEAGEVADEVKKCMYQGHPWQPSSSCGKSQAVKPASTSSSAARAVNRITLAAWVRTGNGTEASHD